MCAFLSMLCQKDDGGYWIVCSNCVLSFLLFLFLFPSLFRKPNFMVTRFGAYSHTLAWCAPLNMTTLELEERSSAACSEVQLMSTIMQAIVRNLLGQWIKVENDIYLKYLDIWSYNVTLKSSTPYQILKCNLTALYSNGPTVFGNNWCIITSSLECRWFAEMESRFWSNERSIM